MAPGYSGLELQPGSALQESRAALCAALAALLAMQPGCLAEIKERCPLVTESRPAPALPPDFAPLDGLLHRRAIQMMRDVHGLSGSATVSFHIWFASETLPLWCARMEQARELARAGQISAAGRKYQAVLVFSQLMELAIAVHAVVEYADAIKEPSLILVQTTETFGNQMEPILAAALSEDPGEIRRALRAHPEVFQQWRQHLARWAARIRADAERVEVAEAVWNITTGVIAAYEAAGALAEIAASGRPPMPPLPALATVGGGAAAAGMSEMAYMELAEAVRKLIASGALDAGVVAALSATAGHMSSSAQMSAGQEAAAPSASPARKAATAPVPKFSDYIFKEGATHGKDAVFSQMGYSKVDSAQLAETWEEQAAAKYARGEFTLGKLDQHGQRIDIEIELHGKGAATGAIRYLRSGWMIQSDGSITLNTPFSGFTR